jgi:hypothetical protein
MKAGSEVNSVISEVNKLVGDELRAVPLKDKVSVEVREVDPLMRRRSSSRR